MGWTILDAPENPREIERRGDVSKASGNSQQEETAGERLPGAGQREDGRALLHGQRVYVEW